MSRPKISVDDALIQKATEELRKIEEGKLAIKLKAIIAYKKHNAELVAEVFQISIRNLFLWVNRFKEYGVEGLIDSPRGHNPSKLTQVQLEKIKEWIISCKTPDGKDIHWTLLKLKLHIQEQFKIFISTVALWNHLHAIGLSVKRPRPKHYKSDKEKQEDFKKN
ncbi:MAG: winged helix-turn-helix domain-containing protein [bacterium]